MPKDLRLKIQRASGSGPDMRKPQYPGGYEPPAEGVAMARFIGYFEVGEHLWRDGPTSTLKDTVLLCFELSGPNHPPKNTNGQSMPHVVSVSMPLELIPGRRFFDTFARMNFEGTVTHMSELLGGPFGVWIAHRSFSRTPGVYATVAADKDGCLIVPAKARTDKGVVVEASVAPPHYALSMFVWDSADVDDWYAIYIPGEWPEERNSSGVLLRPARSKNVIQERIASAANWPEHPLAAVARLGADPNQPTPEELERQRDEEMKELGAENVRRLKAIIDNAVGRHSKAPSKRRARVPKQQ